MKNNFIFFIFLSINLNSSNNDPEIKKILVFGGKTGWIGQKIVKILTDANYQVVATQTRLENRESLELEIQKEKPDCVINAAGVTGVPNVDWCEDHKQETIRSNIIGALNLADISFKNNIHFINIGTGCIYEYDKNHPIYSGIGFKEEEEPNFAGSFYSYTKIMLDKLLKEYPNTLNLRLRMPISDDFHPRNFVTKITKYQKVVNVPNSMSILSDLLPLIPQMAERRLVGVYNFVNPGVISHNEILDLYKEYIDNNFSYTNFSLEEQDKILKARRSNNELDANKLLKEFPSIPNIKDSIKKLFQNINTRKKI